MGKKDPIFSSVIKTAAFAVVLMLGTFAGLLLLLCFVLPYRSLVWCLAKVFRRGFLGFTSGLYSLYTSDPQGTNYLSVSCLDGEIEVGKFRELFQRRVMDKMDGNGGLCHGNLLKYIQRFMGYTFFLKDQNFNLEEHIRPYDYKDKDLALPSPCTEEDLCRVTNKLLSHSWREEWSPWEYLLVRNFKSSKSSKPGMALIFRAHHVLGDGYSVVSFLSDLCGNPVTLPSASSGGHKSKLSRVISSLSLPWSIFYDMAHQMLTVFTKPVWPKGQKSTHDYYTSMTSSIPLSTVKTLKNRLGVNFFSVVLAAVSEAYRRILLEAGREVPEKITFFYPEPSQNHPGKFGNYTNGMFSSLLVRSNSFVEKARASSKILTETRVSQVIPAADGMVDLMGLLPTPLIRASNANLDFITFAISQLPIPNLELEGIPFIDGYSAIRPADTLFAGNMVLTTMRDSMRFLVNLDKSFIKSEEIASKFSKYIEEALLDQLNSPTRLILNDTE